MEGFMESFCSVQKIECSCEHNGEINSELCWTGYILSERNCKNIRGSINNVEGFIEPCPYPMYLIGINGEDLLENKLSFCLFESRIYHQIYFQQILQKKIIYMILIYKK